MPLLFAPAAHIVRCSHRGELTLTTWTQSTQSTSTSKPKPIQCQRPDGHQADGADCTAFHFSDAVKSIGRVVWTDETPKIQGRKTVKGKH